MTGLSRVDKNEWITRGGRYDKRSPAIITNVVNRWPAYGLWSPAWFASQHGAISVHIRTDTSKYQQRYEYRAISLAEFVRDIMAPTAGKAPYLANASLLRTIPSLRRDLAFKGMVPKASLKRVAFWIGPAGTSSKIHCDHADNVLAQIHGQKEIRIYSPDTAVNLYPDPATRTWFSTFSAIDFANPDYGKHPQYLRVTPDFHDILEPGEALYIPNGWWHQVSSLSAAISVNCWWITFADMPKVSWRAARNMSSWVPDSIGLLRTGTPDRGTTTSDDR